MDSCLRATFVIVGLARITVLGIALFSAATGFAARSPRDCAGIACPGFSPVFAQWEAARRIRYGYGMTGRAEIAVRWYEKAAKKGDPRAMHNFGLMLTRGQGIEADRDEAGRWLRASLARGVAESALALGNMARLGHTAAADPNGAAAFYRQGAARGDTRSMHALANLYAAGIGVSQSLAEAYFWYYLAAKKGHLLATSARDAARSRLSPATLRDIERRAEASIQNPSKLSAPDPKN